MHMSPYNAGTSRNWNQWGVITLAVCALLVLTHCDSGFVNSQCTEDQEAIAKEYDSAEWPCEKFVDSVTPGDGTDNHSTGYLSGAYKSGRDAVWSYMSSEFGVSGWIGSDWRCPEGNTRVGGVSGSQHVQGTAGDFTADGFDETMWEKFEKAAIDAGRGWNSAKGRYTSHIHIDWR